MKMWNVLGSGALSIVLALTPLSFGYAQDISESHLAAARNAIAAIEATDRFDDILPNVGLAIKQQLIANNPDLVDEINASVDTETLALASRRADLETAAAEAYARAIAEADLIAIAEFYNSEAGQSLLRNGVIVSREVQQAAGIWQRGIERDLLENVNNKLKEIAPRNVEDETDDATAPATAE